LDNFKEEDVAKRKQGGTAMVKNEVDRAAEGVRRAIGRLIVLFGDDDPGTTYRTYETLVSIGALAAGPLARALPRAASIRHRAAIMNCLMELAPVARPEVLRAMTQTSRREPDPALRACACRNVIALTSAILMEDIARRKSSLSANPQSGS
jgi:hypothetical protein